MFFYKVTSHYSFNNPSDAELLSRERAKNVQVKTSLFNNMEKNGFFIFTECFDGEEVDFGIIASKEINVPDVFGPYAKKLGITLFDTETEETTLREICCMLDYALSQRFLTGRSNVEEQCKVSISTTSMNFGETILKKNTKTEIKKSVDKLLAKNSLLEEIERIYAKKGDSKNEGHPVFYMLESDNNDARKESYKAIIQALFNNGRLETGRYVWLNLYSFNNISESSFDGLYKASKGSAVVIRYFVENGDCESAYRENRENIEYICEIAYKYRRDVLTIICLPRAAKTVKDLFFENFPNISFVEIKEEPLTGAKAKKFLKDIAKEKDLEYDESLLSLIKPNKKYYTEDLASLFENWYDKYLKTTVYPQYAEFVSDNRKNSGTSFKGSAYNELFEMTGLDEAKKVIKQAVDFYKIRKLMKERNITGDKVSMHMVFTGNPGTAKTTVARLFARIMQDNGLLSKGHLVEVGRDELVGKFVGWTAQIVKRKFEAARGGVLFIDEAYSLVDKSGSFGDEAINTIVKEMENNRDDLVVIFAGYPDKMEEFLNKNPGLRSRIAFHVPFSDYSTEELLKITEYMGEKQGLIFTPDAMSKMESVFEIARKSSDFGNGRFARNVIDKAKLCQASRLLSGDVDGITAEELITITGEDVEFPSGNADKKQFMGFCA